MSRARSRRPPKARQPKPPPPPAPVEADPLDAIEVWRVVRGALLEDA